MSLRNREAHAIIGGNGQGKSSFTKQLFPSYVSRGEKVIILTSQDPPAYSEYARLDSIEDVKRLKKGIVKYYDHNDPVRMLVELRDVCISGWKDKSGVIRHVRGGLIVFEDCTNYITDNPIRPIKNFLVDRRMAELDMVFTTHALRFLPKFIRGMVNSVTVFNTAETYEHPRELKNLEYPNYQKLFNAWTKVHNTPKNPNSYIQAHKTIATGI